MSRKKNTYTCRPCHRVCDDRTKRRISHGENCRSLAHCVLELFKNQWGTLYFETDISMKMFK